MRVFVLDLCRDRIVGIPVKAIRDVKRLTTVPHIVRDDPGRANESIDVTALCGLGHFIPDLPDTEWEQPSALVTHIGVVGLPFADRDVLVHVLFAEFQ